MENSTSAIVTLADLVASVRIRVMTIRHVRR